MTAVHGKPDTSFREQTRTIVRDCLLPSNSATKGDDTATFVATCVADVQTRNHDEFDQMCFQLDTSPTSVQPRVVQIFHETFHNGINWGRVIAFLAFMKHFSADCEKRQLYGAVESICEWSGDLITSQLEPWIRAEGGWVKHFQQMCMCVVHRISSVGCN